jgi:PKD repeat protein
VAPLTVSFDATGSTDSQGYRITGYTWNFGDGTTGTGPAVTHTYTFPGTYTVTLTAVSDDTA